MWDFPLFPPQASTIAKDVDRLYFFLVAASTVIVAIVVVLVLHHAIKYRWWAQVDRSNPVTDNLPLELGRVGVLAVVFLVMFLWGATLYYRMYVPPADADVIYVVGKQWMWKFQHPAGRREIDTLHVPIGRPIKLVMTSQDVIHSVFIPAFRVKQDALPGRYTVLWFEATTPGEYHLFCTEYCGAHHARMVGRVIAMQPGDFEAWLAGGKAIEGRETMADAGERLFNDLGCAACHASGGQMAPNLAGIYGQPQPLADGGSAIADEDYIRESIFFPQKKVVAGYQPIMPSYEGQISEEQMLQIIAYLKSLGSTASSDTPGGPTP